MIKSLIADAARSRPRRVGLVEERWLNLAPALLQGVTPAELRAAYLRAVVPAPVTRVDVTHITPIAITVGDAVLELVDRLKGSGSVTFRQLTYGIDDRIGLVVRFLAVLELVKQGLVDVDQASTFGDIIISWTGGDGRSLDAVEAGVDIYEG